MSHLTEDGGRTQSLLLHHDCGTEFFSYCGRIANTKDGSQEGRSDGREKFTDDIYYEPILVILQPWTQNEKKEEKEGKKEGGREGEGRNLPLSSESQPLNRRNHPLGSFKEHLSPHSEILILLV